MRSGIRELMILFLAAFCLGLSGGNVSASPFGDDITIYDGSGSGTGWHGAQEDQETEPGMVGSQAWDLEGFFLDGSNLAMVGGFDFQNGVKEYPQYSSGDIFINVEGNYGRPAGPAGWSPVNGHETLQSSFGYEFVIDLDFSKNTYTYIDLRENDPYTETAYYKRNESTDPSSDPWRYVSGGTVIGNDSFVYSANLSDGQTGLLGGDHYAVSGIGLSFLADQGFTDFTAHFTMGCGNDNLMGHSAPVPEPASVLLFGSGLVGLAGVWRRKREQG